MLLSEIAHIVSPSAVLSSDYEINYLLTDSRQLHTAPQETLFFALKTPTNDGAKYIAELYDKGVRAFITETPVSITGAEIIVVSNALSALQRLAAYKRSLYPNAVVIGITGSNGKTVVKEWLYELLKDDYAITRSPKSYNSQIGVPLSVWQMNDKTELAIFEAGISEKGEMERLERIIRPTIGVLTFIGEEHGENFSSLEEKRAEKLKLFKDCKTVIEDPTHQNLRTCAAVLRYLGYDEETIQHKLLTQTHETVMQVNLSALADNVRYFRSLLLPDTKLVCMVKAFAYGAGPIEISRCLQQNRLADYLAVAVADEAAELRQSGINLPIIIMDPELSALEEIIENNAEPNIYSFESLNNFLHAVETAGLENYPIHIKIDSGMHRLGFELGDMPKLISMLQQQNKVRVASVFSHLAAADEAQWNEFTLDQIHRFNECADYIKAHLNYPIIKHILNSAGIQRFPRYQFDMVRLGVGAYGISALPDVKLAPVASLRCKVLQVKTLSEGETVGYGRHGMAREGTVIATIPVGYADGIDRHLGQGRASFSVNGHRAPTIGNICMDMCMIDVTGIPVAPGDTVTVFGEDPSVEELAGILDTIPYEIFTSIPRRIERVIV